MQSVTRSTTTLIFKHTCKTVCWQQVFLTMASFKIMEILFFLRLFSVASPFQMEKSLLFMRRLFNFQPERDDQLRVSLRVKIILILVDVLGISETIPCEQGFTCYSLEGSLYGLKMLFIEEFVWINCSD